MDTRYRSVFWPVSMQPNILHLVYCQKHKDHHLYDHSVTGTNVSFIIFNKKYFRKFFIIEMISSKSKTSFAIDDLLCNNTENQRPSSASKPSYNTINGNIIHPELHHYLQNCNPIPFFSQQIEHFNPFSFHHYPRLPPPYMDPLNTFNSSKFLT